MSQIWLSIEQVIELGYPRRSLYRQLSRTGTVPARGAQEGGQSPGKLTAGLGGKAKNGKRRTEILLTSLPAAIQAAYLKKVQEFKSSKDQSSGGGDNTPEIGGAADNGSEAPSPGSRAPDLPAASPSLSRTGTGTASRSQSPENPLARLAEEEIEELTNYADALQRAEGQSRQQRRWIARREKVSLSTLDRDIKLLDEEGLSALARKARADRGRSRVADESVVARIQTEYLKPCRPTAQAVYEKIKKDFELSNRAPPSFTWALRQIEKTPRRQISKGRLGEKHYRDHYEYSSTRRRPERPREWVDADHHEADHYVVFPDGAVGRPFITAVHDLCTSEILGFRIPRDKRVGRGHAPGALDIGLTVRQAILRKKGEMGTGTQASQSPWPSFGLFEHFYHDLGKDFLSSHLRAALADLHIRPVPCRGYHGQSKPIERWFRTFEDGTRELPGYCGNKPENNPYRSGALPQKPDPKTLMTVEEYEAAAIEWIVKTYHHRGQAPLGGASPLEALAAHVKNGFTPREVRDERALDLLLMRRARRAGGKLVKIQKDGFRLFGRLYFHPELAHLIGEEIDPRYDEGNLGEIICYHEERFVCVATNKELLDFGATRADLIRANDIRREQRRRDEEWLEERIKQAQYPAPLARARAERMSDEVMEEERRAIAAGATAPSVPVLMPKYQRTVKLLGNKALQQKAHRVLTEVKSKKAEGKSEKETNPYLENKKLSSREIFKRERNEYLEED